MIPPRRKSILVALGIILLTGCATPEWAKNEDWRKKSHWENEKTDNPGLLGGLIEAAASSITLLNGK